MSLFLGPIHHWLYNKIILFERLEKYILDGLIAEVGKEAEILYGEACDRYGQPLDQEKTLEEIIDLDNIHQWLQDKIQRAELRHGYFLNKSIEKFGDLAYEVALEYYAKQGKYCGEKCEEEARPQNAQELYDQLNNYILDGMPCDHVNQVQISEPDLVQWEVTQCLHIDYWNQVGIDPNKMYKLRETWIDAFVAYANSHYEYRFTNDNGILKHVIQKVTQ
ncbi:hypothetical protein [Anaerobranca gottschalkii]|uniref:Uncharacterized protein n=1 Tax=Anaerobranca gottschalkii DSM 13577 TaxID=1120990 RepID=A0A1I0ADB8_9FIRM|nr:hypothetical protein [Anaerobranca gottschalkii]SES92218.1 hypothetical protein SAMN03080614_102021 [Anaerobranca gottschalkii DSM 13577]